MSRYENSVNRYHEQNARAIERYGQERRTSRYYDACTSFLDHFGDNLDIDLIPEYEYEEVEDYDGRRASRRHIKIGGHINYRGKNRQGD